MRENGSASVEITLLDIMLVPLVFNIMLFCCYSSGLVQLQVSRKPFNHLLTYCEDVVLCVCFCVFT